MCLTYSCVWFPSVSHNQVLGVQVSECVAYQSVSHIRLLIHSMYHVPVCLACPSVWCPSVSHIQVQVSKCLTYPSAYSFSAPHIQVPVHSMSHISECWVSKCQSVWFPSASHIRMCGFRVPECIAYPSVSHIQVSHISKCGRPSVGVYSISKCLTYPSVWFPSAGVQVSHISEFLFIRYQSGSDMLHRFAQST
jgi:hypothetical protein